MSQLIYNESTNFVEKIWSQIFFEILVDLCSYIYVHLLSVQEWKE